MIQSSTEKPSADTLGGSTHVPPSLLVEMIGEVGQGLGTCHAKGPSTPTPEGSVPPSLPLGLHNTRGPSTVTPEGSPPPALLIQRSLALGGGIEALGEGRAKGLSTSHVRLHVGSPLDSFSVEGESKDTESTHAC